MDGSMRNFKSIPMPLKNFFGWYDVSLTQEGKNDPVCQYFGKTEKIFQWHGDTFEIPHGAIHLAKSRDCPHQAMRYGDKTYGFQFHLEVDQPMIERWLEVPRHIEELAGVKGRIDPEEIKKQTPQFIQRSMSLSEGTFGEFIKLFGMEKKYRCPPSR